MGHYAKIDKDNITIISQLFSDDGLKSFSVQKSGDKKFPAQLGISAGKDLLKQSKGKYKKKRCNFVIKNYMRRIIACVLLWYGLLSSVVADAHHQWNHN